MYTVLIAFIVYLYAQSSYHLIKWSLLSFVGHRKEDRLIRLLTSGSEEKSVRIIITCPLTQSFLCEIGLCHYNVTIVLYAMYIFVTYGIYLFLWQLGLVPSIALVMFCVKKTLHFCLHMIFEEWRVFLILYNLAVLWA